MPPKSITIYLCPEQFQAPGIETAQGNSAVDVETDEALGLSTVTVRLLPDGSLYTGEQQQVTAYLCPESADELACFLCNTRQKREPNAVLDKIVSMLNAERASRKCWAEKDCEAQLERDSHLDRAGKLWIADKYELGLTSHPSNYFQKAGVSTATYVLVDAFVFKGPLEKLNNLALSDADIQAAIAEWLADNPIFREVLEAPNLNLCGGAVALVAGDAFAFAEGAIAYEKIRTSAKVGWHIVICLAEAEKQPVYPIEVEEAPPSDACDFRCVKRLEYYAAGEADPVMNRTYGVVFRVHVPDLCAIREVSLWGDIFGERWRAYCLPNTKIPCGGEPLSRTEDGILAGETFEVNTYGNEPFPGELMYASAYLDGSAGDDCNPIILAFNYYSHPCLTSGPITKVKLVEGKTAVEERAEGETPKNWIGDTRLRYEVLCEGELLTVRPSDFSRYLVGERVMIHKGGAHTEIQHTGSFGTWSGEVNYGKPTEYVVAGCQDPDNRRGSNHHKEVFSWRIVRPLLNNGADGLIIPAVAFKGWHNGYAFGGPPGFSHHDTYIELDYRLGRITAIDHEKETCDLEILDVNYQPVGETYEDVPILYHCFPDAELLANGAVEGAAAAFLVDDVVRVNFADPENPVVHGHHFELRPCLDLYFFYDPVEVLRRGRRKHALRRRGEIGADVRLSAWCDSEEANVLSLWGEGYQSCTIWSNWPLGWSLHQVSITEGGIGLEYIVNRRNGKTCSSSGADYSDSQTTDRFGEFKLNFAQHSWPYLTNFAILKEATDREGYEYSDITAQRTNQGRILVTGAGEMFEGDEFFFMK